MSLSDSYFLHKLTINYQDIGVFSDINSCSHFPSLLASTTSSNWTVSGKEPSKRVSNSQEDIELLLEDIQEIKEIRPSILVILASIEGTLSGEDSLNSSCVSYPPSRSNIPHEHQIEAVFLKVISEFYDEDVSQSIKLLEEIMIHGIRSPRLASIHQVIFSMLSSNYTNSRTDEVIRYPASSFLSQISLNIRTLNNSPPSEVVTPPQIILGHTNDTSLKLDTETVTITRKIVKNLQDKRYPCAQCEKTFDRPSALASHRKTHSCLREFTCSLCSSEFKFKHDMERHIRRHTGEKPYPCCYCDQGFYRSDTMTIHMKTKHPDVKTAPSGC